MWWISAEPLKISAFVILKGLCNCSVRNVNNKECSIILSPCIIKSFSFILSCFICSKPSSRSCSQQWCHTFVCFAFSLLPSCGPPWCRCLPAYVAQSAVPVLVCSQCESLCHLLWIISFAFILCLPHCVYVCLCCCASSFSFLYIATHQADSRMFRKKTLMFWISTKYRCRLQCVCVGVWDCVCPWLNVGQLHLFWLPNGDHSISSTHRSPQMHTTHTHSYQIPFLPSPCHVFPLNHL